jgi:molybdate transport system substrate-binding protein
VKRRTFVALAVALLALVAACSSSKDDPGSTGGASTSDEDRISVFAMTRLQQRLEELSALYVEEHPGLSIDFTFGDGTELAAEIREGGEVDLYVDLVERVENVAGQLDRDPPRVFVSEVLQIAVALGNPKAVTGLDVFGEDPTTLSGLCTEDVGCGQSARDVLQAAGVTPSADAVEPTAGDLLRAVADGELDAGLLFRHQIATAPTRVQGIDLPADNNAETVYLIGVLSDDAAAADFATWLVESPEADAILVESGLRARP